jgi:hypothetical protein
MQKVLSSVLLIFLLILNACSPKIYNWENNKIDEWGRASAEIENSYTSASPGAIVYESEERNSINSTEGYPLENIEWAKTKVKKVKAKPVSNSYKFNLKKKDNVIHERIMDDPPIRKTNQNALLGFIFSFLGLVIFPLGIIGFVLGIIGLKKIYKNTELYKGQGFAIAAIILGGLFILIILLYLVLLSVLYASTHNW